MRRQKAARVGEVIKRERRQIFPEVADGLSTASEVNWRNHATAVDMIHISCV
ncbi:hypothetical protein LG047_09080 [Methylocystis sp. WRRC1]|uniref:hypothetical protein n=1 Tax=Methylocystis sp. WRRC1 TaxID=1732014 RepID=UPI001D13B9B3|nr:hypothetical protein [Methylocystis sp. WRRC1]MCC3245471.1 hypothetical protein [Methylocystis sp. WRRC1]